MIENHKNREKKTKIALVCYSLSNGGLERVVSNYSFMFSEMGLDVHVYVLRSEIDYPFAGTLHSFDIENFSGSEKIRKYIQLRKSIRNTTFDLIIDHRYRLNPIQEFLWQQFIYKNQKVVNYVHSSDLSKYLFPYRWANNLIFGKRRFICVSKGIEQKIQRMFPDLSTATVYSPVIPQNNPDPDISETPDSFILAVARMDRTNVKQIDVLLECFAKSNLPSKNYKLLIIGSGERQTQMEALATELRIQDKVLFKGFLANPYPYFPKAKFTVLMSKYEGLGVVLIESLLSGTPVISYDCESGPREIIQNEENGLLVENQNKTAFIKAMNRLAEDEHLYQKLKANSKKSAEKFTPEKIIPQWNDLLHYSLK